MLKLCLLIYYHCGLSDIGTLLGGQIHNQLEREVMPAFDNALRMTAGAKPNTHFTKLVLHFNMWHFTAILNNLKKSLKSEIVRYNILIMRNETAAVGYKVTITRNICHICKMYCQILRFIVTIKVMKFRQNWVSIYFSLSNLK